ncbi:class I mannose-6-phosphate isomerase [Microbacterium sp.]|uniref:class I mannose-6-phosphate isomerase n=1 Tax=Microbacterium sp. TaxID=51671 RepID=UPI003A87FEA0
MPIVLPSNRPADRFYRGGARIVAFRGGTGAPEREPEDWVGSTTTVSGEDVVGLTRLGDAELLRDAIEADPVGWLGAPHANRWGADSRLLVKLLDAGQRLPVHAHPNDDFAASHLGRAHGKAEAWYILERGTVYVGLRHDVAVGHLRELVDRQDTAGLLELLHEVHVEPGDVVWVPPGELHAIGAGILLLELQQPEDLSILLEWHGFALGGTTEGHLGLGFDVALEAVTRAGRSASEIAEFVMAAPTSGSVFPPAADAYFRLERHPVDGEVLLESGFAIVVVTDGPLEVGGLTAPRGTTLLTAASEGALAVSGVGEVLVARPPAP